ncbi:hypothetical protein GLOIN_2v1490054 [Rhizophagus irregularis DAOM 181602=DAOM 197198]|uniref:Uncharacterized protein n=1 Tax=Rhizophagus irregularis (strain DAOM 181602 / DAOM 197198 / MUCL 43194) TaxID=747089 RepID=A0A2P4QZV2_RHIID|nr:hypothetical protein GLOIN_2v1490054 [Rhizophagus irregularis DAOM 181602=DAOM 197198]POG83181.1 hypothetical protein GLOIN_2v1490054 [Rhizophagus irregularis DAOM 181602=DAOM 197198]|eukprot:XP_025190047.1 hypothetical protein GLOIN_2v1490054 [Rhizophagus irregularis DAOM 181602=DAOM 197198]
MQYFQNFEYEIKINIYKYIDFPLNLALTCRNWSVISKDAYAKTEWLLVRYGKSHALFQAVRLGPTFIDIPVCKTLITRKVPISRYFIQRLLMHFGKYDQKLIELKIEHNVGQLDADRIRAFQQKIKSPWASNLPIFVFTYLLDEGYKQLANMNETLPSKGNDMELFHFLSAGPHVINYAPGMLRKNLKDIEDLILNKRFVPFPPRPKAYQLDLNSDPHIHQQPIPEEYPSKDGFENNRQLNVIARGILIHPDLVNLWKQIGYYEICNDVNDLVMQGALLILFPPTPASDWSCPSIEMVISRLAELINLGFSLKDNVIIDALHMFEHRLDEIGDILWDAFLAIRSGENVYSLALKFFREAFKPERNLKKDDLLNFLKSKFVYHEQVIKQVVKQYFIEEKMSDITLRRKSLILSPKIYQYVLRTYSKDSELTVICFEDILTLRIYIDSPRNLEEISTCTRDSIISVFDSYIKENVLFKPKYLDLLQKATSLEIIKPFFEIFLPTIFGMKPTSKRGKSTPKKRKKLTDELVVPWVKKLEQIDSLNRSNHGELSINFREYFMSFCKRLESETTYQIREENFFVAMNYYHNDLNQHKKQRRNDNQTDQDVNMNMNFNDTPDFFRNIFN